MEPAISKDIQAPIDDVWAILANGWTYSGWVVGASRIRAVDHTFPAKGAALHQSVGLWPLVIDDVTTVLESRAPEYLVLEVRSRPFLVAEVHLRLSAAAPDVTTVQMEEEIVRGPVKWLPRKAQAPVLNWRNNECLERLARLARHDGDSGQPG